MIILKFMKRQSFTPSLEDEFLVKPDGGGGGGVKLTPFPSVFRVKYIVFTVTEDFSKVFDINVSCNSEVNNLLILKLNLLFF